MRTHFQIARSLAQLLDNQFSFLGFKFGLDPIIGMIPFLGDVISLCLSLYILWIGYQANLSPHLLSKMVQNVVLDFLLGLIPGVGDVADFFYKANSKNIEILERELKYGEIIEGEFA